ncbi:hypothetical protein DLAC_06194 [Tieghemostelium lacteum]|uniref:MACPF domain-containing protein n=1 Tax=Tieghemostelium lacteum TaxID=361077 RepID=A0A151ZHM9_TIELA|nr:hypothetical protein DLAC_06194 [Tieghemostelium lacteum]|eukprot:KYQ93498.1 hypothetical protein DLAC_06194 [Tieghemostelium lacteum]
MSDAAPTLFVQPRTYDEVENKGIVINRSIEITTTNTSLKAVIDCKNFGSGFQISNSKLFVINNFEFTNCVHKKGGGLSISNSRSILRNIAFSNNKAIFGGGLYIEGKSSSLDQITFDNNNASKRGNSMFISNSVVKFLTNPKLDKSSMSCQNNAVITLEKEFVSTENIILDCQNCQFKSLNPLKDICKVESSSIKDCVLGNINCEFSGLILQYGDQYSHIPKAQLYNIDRHLNNNNLTLNIDISGYFTMNEGKYIELKVSGNNIGVQFNLDGKIVYHIPEVEMFNKTIPNIYVNEGTHYFKMYISATSLHHRKFNLLSDLPFFYSDLPCDKTHKSDCSKDSKISKLKTSKFIANCTDGFCNEDPNTCLSDCHEHLSKKCPPRTVPQGHISPGFFFSDDTLGNLISNQFIWKLPGSEHLTFGVNIINSEEGNAPIFSFDYCNNVAPNVVEDPYRGMVYEVVDQLNVKILPICTYSTTSTSFSSSSEVVKSMTSSISASFSAEASGEFMGTGAEASVALSGEKSVSALNSLSITESQKIIKVDLDCTSSYVEIDDKNLKFHPIFLKELSSMKDSLDALKLVEKYGTHYYKNAFLGGKLTQFTVMSKSTSQSKSQNDMEENAEASFSASASEAGFQAGGSASGSIDKSMSHEEQAQMESSASRTSIQTYGGAPGTFAPSDIIVISSYSVWASTIDQNPVPINYNLFPIRDLLKKENWKTASNANVFDLWEKGEQIFLLQNNMNFEDSPYSLIINRINRDHDSSKKPVIIFDYYPNMESYNKKQSKLYETNFYLTHTETNGDEYSYSYRDKTSTNNCWENTDFLFSLPNWTGKNSKYCDQKADGQVDVTVFNFNGPDFFSPQIKSISFKELSAAMIDTMYLINWNTHESMVFRSNENESNSTRHFIPQDNTDKLSYFGLIAYEKSWAWHGSDTFNSINGVYGTCPGTTCNDHMWMGIVGDPITTGAGQRDYLNTADFRNSMLDISSNRMNSSQQNTWMNWKSFKLKLPNSSISKSYFTLDNIPYAGTQVRVDWILIFFPSNSNTLTKDIYYYNVVESDLEGAQQFTEVNLNLNVKFTTDPYSNMGFYPLKPIAEAPPRHHFFFHNYNYRRDGIKVTRDTTASEQKWQFQNFNINSPDPPRNFIYNGDSLPNFPNKN